MRYILIVILTLIMLSCQNKNKEYKPVDVEFVKSLKYDYIDIQHKYSTQKRFISIYEFTKYQNTLDSLKDKYFNNHRIYDSLKREENYGMFDGLRKTFIIKYDSIKDKQAILYWSGKLDNENFGCWIAIKNKHEANWEHYYTGITNNEFFHLKVLSNIPLFYNDSTIQLDVALVRKLTYGSHWELAKYELIEDSLLLKINLKKITIDTDKDGLTDIVEKKYHTLMNNLDTDDDGIIDSEDKNPRFKNVQSDISNLIIFLLEGTKNNMQKYYYYGTKTGWLINETFSYME